jgi:menaquinol-cytochrome c reductase iron-sulfur subunit
MAREPDSPNSGGHVASATRGKVPSQDSRRSFLAFLLGAGSAGVGALLSVPLVRFALHPLLRVTTPAAWSEVGRVDEFASTTLPAKQLIILEQRDGWRKRVSEKTVYVIKDANGELGVLSSVCPHLGCSAAWHPEMGNFLCHCHNGLFAPDGKLLAGPPPRGMDRLETKIEDGILKVRYQYFRQLVPHKEVIA